MASRDAEAHLVFFKALGALCRRLHFLHPGHRGSQRISSCTSSTRDTWPRVEEHCYYGPAASYSLSAMCRVPEFWASTSSVRSRGIRGTVQALTVSMPWAPCPTERRVGAYTYYTLDTWLTGSVSVPTPSKPWTPWPTGQRVGLCNLYTWGTAGPVWLGMALRWPTSAFGFLGDQSAAAPVACAGPGIAEHTELGTYLSHLAVPTSLSPCVSARAA